MNTELFNDMPFNLAGEELREEIDQEGQDRLDAENKANERKAQTRMAFSGARNWTGSRSDSAQLDPSKRELIEKWNDDCDKLSEWIDEA